MTEPFQIIGEEMETDILVVDDETEWLDTLRVLFEMKGWNVATASSAGEGLRLASARSFALVLCDLAMPGMSGMDMLKELRAADNRTPFIIMTGVGTIPSAVEAMRFGAFNYITKPFDADELEALVRQAIEFGRFHRMLAEEGARGAAEPEMMLGTGRAMESVLSTVDRIAESTASVLIQGETGTGKSLLAKYIHKLSARREGPFLTIDCGAMPEGLLESELFGHVRGAFTGAMNARRGLLQEAEGGTVFLDEIAELSPSMQVKLLRVLQERTFERVGSNKTQSVDVRIIAATHKNLESMIEVGSFREDLYYRLNVFPIEMAPLRERVEDIPLLMNELISRMEHEKRGSIRFNSAAIMSLCRHGWPGNVRELANLVERMAIMHPYGVIGVVELPKKFRYVDDEDEQLVDSLRTDLEERVAINGHTPDFGSSAMLPPEGLDLKDYLGSLEQGLIQQALDDANGIVARAAERLRIRRTTLVEKMRKYGMSRREGDEQADD